MGDFPSLLHCDVYCQYTFHSRDDCSVIDRDLIVITNSALHSRESPLLGIEF